MPPESSHIPRKAYELPLLKSLVELGGMAVPGDALYSVIAQRMALPERLTEYDAVHARPKWVYELQWARHALVKQGDMDGSQRGVWAITEKGRERVRSEWPSYQSGQYFGDDSALDREMDEEVASSQVIQEDVTEEFSAKFVPESFDAVKGQILIDDTPVNQLVTIINASRHVIVTGPPGTGKTSIAINAAQQAVSTRFVSGYVLTTATSDWTTFDTIGGYMPQSEGNLAFNPGIVLHAIGANNWLIIDEINRADVDKAFGQLLTILSGQNVELPYLDPQGKPIRLCRANGLRSYYEDSTATFYIGDNWRIIGTMNTFDKNSLFSLSYAFMRRFGFVHVNNPSRAFVHRIIDGRVQDRHLNPSDAQRIKRLLSITPRELGPAILIDILNYLKERNSPQGFFESVVAYVLPQFEGLSVEDILHFYAKSVGDLGDEECQARMKRYLSEMFEIEAEAWEAVK